MVDPGIETSEESFTPLHFAAQYTPQIINKDVQLQEMDSSKQIVDYLVYYKNGLEVEASDLYSDVKRYLVDRTSVWCMPACA